VSTPIWDQGDVLASLCATNCDRCDKRGRCVQIFLVQPLRRRHHINLCVECFEQLQVGVEIARGVREQV